MDNTQLTNLYFQLHRFARLAARQHHMHRPEHPPMLRGQDRLLSILMEQDGIAQKEIVERMDIRPSSAGELVEKLEEAGFVERRSSEGDKRISNVYLTELGHQTALQTARAREGMLEETFSALNMEEREQLASLLERLNDSLQDKAPEKRGRKAHGHGCEEDMGPMGDWYGPHGEHGHHGHHPHHCPPPPHGRHPKPPHFEDPSED